MATKGQAVAVVGFGVDSKAKDRTFGSTMTYGKMKLLSVIVSTIPASRSDLGMSPNQKLNWEYGGWTPEMVATAHKVIDKYVGQLPKREQVSQTTMGKRGGFFR